MITAELLAKHAALWRAATHHPFLEGVRAGSLPEEAFNRWLEQDYRFVATALRAQCDLLAQAPRADQLLLANGLVALATELDWFERHLAARGLRIDAPLLPTNRAYSDYLVVMARAPYPAALMVAATAERAYYEAWSTARPAAPAYTEFVDRWTNEAFRAYVEDLARATDRALADASPEEIAAAEDAFVWTARYEAAFWQMTFEQR